MPALKITLPQDIYRIAHKRASAMGYKTIAEYVTALILVESGERNAEHPEAKPPNSLNLPAVKATPK